MSRRRWLAVSGLAVSLSSALLAATPSARALPVTVPATIVSSGCSKPLAYQESIGDGKYAGVYPGYKPHGASGKVTYCTFKYRLKDSDPSADYYIGELQEAWVKTRDAVVFFGGRGGAWSAGMGSTLAARDRVFNGTPTYKKTVIVGCPSLVAGYTFMGVGLNLTQTLCGSETVTRSRLTKWGASWQNGTASNMKHEDLTFSEKVANKKVPTLTMLAIRPAYAYRWTRVMQTDHGYTYPAWKPTLKRSSLSWATTR